MLQANRIYCTDAKSGLKKLDNESIDCIVTSPPYWALRDYKNSKQIGLEKNFTEYLNKLLDVFNEAKRVLKEKGTLWIVIGDTYGGSHGGYGQNPDSAGFQNVVKQKYYPTSHIRPITAHILPKSLIGIPYRFAVAMIDNGWKLRNTLIWYKPNAMPESAKDRFTNDFEYLFFFVKSKNYYFNQVFEPLKQSTFKRARNGAYSKKLDSEVYKGINIQKQKKYYDKILNKKYQGRNMRCVWEIATRPSYEAHFAVFPEGLIEIPIRAGCPKGGIVLDPFIGSGTTAKVAKRLGMKYIGFDINPQYKKIANQGLGVTDDVSSIAEKKLKALQLLKI